jgi:hypothetical protein
MSVCVITGGSGVASPIGPQNVRLECNAGFAAERLPAAIRIT